MKRGVRGGLLVSSFALLATVAHADDHPVPTVADLTTLIGQPLAAPKTAMLASLGEPARTENDAQLIYASAGIAVTTTGPKRVITAIQLAPPYPHRLPDGLVFGEETFRSEGLRRLGSRSRPTLHSEYKNATTEYFGPLHHWSGGYTIEFERHRIARVTLHRKRKVGETIFDDFTVHPHREKGVHLKSEGVILAFRRSADPRPEEPMDGPRLLRERDCTWKRATISLTVDGKAIPLAPPVLSVRGLCGDGEDEVFVPYRAIDLPAGTHHAVFTISAPGGAKASTAPFDLEMPATRLVRLHVAELQLHENAFAGRNLAAVLTVGMSSLWKRPKVCPDLTWQVYVGESLVHASSKSKGCGYKATWRDGSPWFRVSAADSVGLYVVDIDWNGGEHLGTFTWKPAELLTELSAPHDLASGKIVKLRLDGSEWREGDVRIADLESQAQAKPRTKNRRRTP